MATPSALLAGSDDTARWRGRLLILVVMLAAGTSALVSNSSAANASGASGGSPTSRDLRDARIFVAAHNAVRAAVRKPAGYPGAWTPLPPVSWSDEVASTAQSWAEHLRDEMKCGLMHSDTRYGENLAGGKKVDAEGAVRMWAGEMDNYRYSPRYKFDKRFGHYTQIVWRKTTHIGCGRASCGRNSVVVCRYSPPGNNIGRAPY